MATLFPYTTLFRSIDISTWQKPSQINYDHLAKEVDFVILRAGYTGHGTGVSLHKDDAFEQHYKAFHERGIPVDRKSTRLNSSHVAISHAVFCLKKKKRMFKNTHRRQQKQTRNTEEVVQESHPGQQYSQR